MSELPSATPRRLWRLNASHAANAAAKLSRLAPILFVLSSLLGHSLATASQAAQIYKDDTGHTVALKHPAQRVISLAPSLTELIYEAGAGDKLVGAVEYSDYPPEALKIPRVGSNQKLDIERIAALKPDLILVWFHGNAQREVDQLSALGIPMFRLEPKRIDDVAGALERIGQLLGTSGKANAAASRFRGRLATLRAKYQTAPHVRVFYQVWAKPLMTINGTHLISDVLALCGGENVFEKAPMLVPQLSTESVVAANPDVILTANMANAAPGSAQRNPDDASFAIWKPFTAMTAVKTRQMWTIPGDTISRHGPRVLDGAQAVCSALDAARAGK